MEDTSEDCLFFVWMLHGSTRFVVRAVALLSANQGEEKSSGYFRRSSLTSSSTETATFWMLDCNMAMLGQLRAGYDFLREFDM